jgi:hemerythrin
MIPIAKMIWSDSYSVGVPELDQQHKVLFEIINCVADFGASSSAARSESFHNILNSLFAYVHKHFAEEQAYLRKIQYPEYEDHVAQHESFLNDLDSLSNRAMDENLDSIELYRFLSDWLSEHVLELDQQYRRYDEASHRR